ncbi:MAG: proline dehydrogenase [Polyangiaceae bacterium]|nr:proline dehydrogenase [Polyangiaceae bacterium]
MARRVADPGDALGREARAALAVATGLSRAGIDLALRSHLEHSPSAAELDALLSGAERAPRCSVVLAANVCTAALRALACAVACAPLVCVRPSRRDGVLAGLLVREAQHLAAYAPEPGTEPPLELVTELRAAPGELVHAYGSDATLARLERALPPGVELRAHGSGFGLAAVGADSDLSEAARALAADVVPFDQAGCLSPRVALVAGGAARAEDFALRLDTALDAAARVVPRGVLAPATQAALARFEATFAAVGLARASASHVVGFDPAPEVLVLPPAARAVLVVAAEPARVAGLVGPYAAALTALGAVGDRNLADAVAALAPHARRSALGAMQRPPFDGPVDLRPRRAAPAHTSRIT